MVVQRGSGCRLGLGGVERAIRSWLWESSSCRTRDEEKKKKGHMPSKLRRKGIQCYLMLDPNLRLWRSEWKLFKLDESML